MAEESSEAGSLENPPKPSNFFDKQPNQEEKLEIEDTDTAALPETKRRKTCLKSLEKVQELSPSNGNFSFTFDTKFIACVPEVTPKFGSFTFAEKEQDQDRNRDQDQGQPSHKSKHKEGAQQVEEGEEKESGVRKARIGNGISASSD